MASLTSKDTTLHASEDLKVTVAAGPVTTGVSSRLTLTLAMVEKPELEIASMQTSVLLSASTALVWAGAVTESVVSSRTAAQPSGAVTIAVATPTISTVKDFVSP